MQKIETTEAQSDFIKELADRVLLNLRMIVLAGYFKPMKTKGNCEDPFCIILPDTERLLKVGVVNIKGIYFIRFRSDFGEIDQIHQNLVVPMLSRANYEVPLFNFGTKIEPVKGIFTSRIDLNLPAVQLFDNRILNLIFKSIQHRRLIEIDDLISGLPK